MKSGQRVEVLVAMNRGMPAFAPARVVASITHEGKTTFNVLTDCGRYLYGCREESMRQIVAEEQQ